MVHVRWLPVREDRGLGFSKEEGNCCLSENLKEKMEETVPLRRTDSSQEGLVEGRVSPLQSFELL